MLLGFSLVAAACGSDDKKDAGGSDGSDEGADGPDPDGNRTGTLIWVHEQEPSDMHLDDPENNLSITSWILQSMYEGLYGVSSDTAFIPELLAAEAEVVENDDDTVTVNYTLRDGLQWSDGKPLTSADVEWWHGVLVEGCATEDDGSIDAASEDCAYLIGSRDGYEAVTDFTVKSETEFSVTFAEFFAGYKAMYNRIYPQHAFGDGAGAAEANEMLRGLEGPDGVLPASGPLVFSSWDRGSKMNLVRNDEYHGSSSPEVTNDGTAFVEGVEIQFVADTDTQVSALTAKTGQQAHIIFTQPQTQFEQLASNDDFTVASTAGPTYEHWGFNLLNKHLAKPEVREAIAYALDKGEIVEGLYSPLFGDLLPVEGLGNTYWMSNQADYEDHQTEYGKGEVDKAQGKLEDAGYAAGADGVYAHPDDGKLTLRVGTTGGNKLREDQLQIIQQQMADAGIDITIDNVPGSGYFDERVFHEDSVLASTTLGKEGNPNLWDITQFAWVGGPWPGSNTAAYQTASGNNPYAYSNKDFDAKAAECETMTDEAARADCYNEADKFVTTLENGPNGLVVLPLTQKPSFFGYLSSKLASAGVSPDANDAGPLVNVVDYQFK